MFNEVKINEIKEFLATTSNESRVYLGCDSRRLQKKGKWYALYTIVMVVHMESKHGCKLFGYNVLESDFDANKKRPFMRMMNEAYKVAELYQAFEYELIDLEEVQIHLDINPDEIHGSSCAVKAAAGYILGTCGIDPKVKPYAWAASYAADRMVRGLIPEGV
jgi:predicted RNase H-related nuclease YkuK (DUF458 family)